MEHYWLLGATSAASQMTTKAHCITDDDPEVIAANNNNDARTLLFLAYANARKVQVALICHSYCSSCGAMTSWGSKGAALGLHDTKKFEC